MASHENWVAKNGGKDFRPVSSYILETVEDRHIITMED